MSELEIVWVDPCVSNIKGERTEVFHDILEPILDLTKDVMRGINPDPNLLVIEEELDIARYETEVTNELLLVVEPLLDVSVEVERLVKVHFLLPITTFNFFTTIPMGHVARHLWEKEFKIALAVAHSFSEQILGVKNRIKALLKTTKCDNEVAFLVSAPLFNLADFDAFQFLSVIFFELIDAFL